MNTWNKAAGVYLWSKCLDHSFLDEPCFSYSQPKVLKVEFTCPDNGYVGKFATRYCCGL